MQLKYVQLIGSNETSHNFKPEDLILNLCFSQLQAFYMTKNQETIAEEIIRLFWDNAGHSYNWYTIENYKLKLPDLTMEAFNEQMPLIKDELLAQGVIRKSIGIGDCYTRN